MHNWIMTIRLLSFLNIFPFEVRYLYEGHAAQKANVFKGEHIMAEKVKGKK